LRGFDEVEIYIIGGMRILGIASYYYSILISPFKKIKAVCFTENMENSYELLTYVPRAPEGKEIIELMSELKEPREIKEIASNLNKTVSTVSKQLSKISDLVDCVDSRPKRCKLNELGRILLDEMTAAEKKGRDHV
ncbi:CRISPR locus-related DNA-binding protein, partial [Sulfolobus sp. F1]